MAAARTDVVGNRVVLIGGLVYLLEWAAIIPVSMAGAFGPVEPGTKSPDEVLAIYSDSARRVAFLAGWLSIVLLGRIAVVAGIRSAVRPSPVSLPLADAAVGAMAVSVALEVIAFSIVAGAAHVAATGADASFVAGLDGVAGWMEAMVFAPLGASVLLVALSMLRSRSFPRWLCWLGVAAGGLVALFGLLGAVSYGGSGALQAATDLAGIGMPVFWLWMIATGVFLFRKTPRHGTTAAAP